VLKQKENKIMPQKLEELMSKKYEKCFLVFFIIVAAIILVVTVMGNISNAFVSPNSDFGSYWYAGNILRNHTLPITEIYDFARSCTGSLYGAFKPPVQFNYSIPVAYLFVPLTYLSYIPARIVLCTVLFCSYLLSVYLLLKRNQISGTRLYLVMAVSTLYVPFLFSQHWPATDPFLLLCTVIALVNAEKKPCLAGVLIGVAALFKIYPLFIAVMLGIKNWRIALGAFLIFGAAFLIPGEMAWIHNLLIPGNVITRESPLAVVPVYCQNHSYFYLFALCASITTIIALFKNRVKAYDVFVVLSIVTMFVIMPAYEYQHFVLMIIPFIYIYTHISKLPGWLVIVATISLVLISAGFSVLDIYGVLLLWMAMLTLELTNALNIKRRCETD
jgi:hypothetical protein